MKTKFVSLLGLLVTSLFLNGCIIHEHRHGYYRHSARPVVGHVHGPGCGHVLRGEVWITP